MITEQEYEAGLSREMKLAYLRQRQSLPLPIKIRLTQRRVAEFYEKMEGKVYVSFSGGKDSTVLLHIVRQMYPDVVAVFSDTGLEYPEIREFVKTVDNVIVVKPKKTFKQVVEEYGYPVISKKVARMIYDCQTAGEHNKNTVRLRLEGIRRDGGKAANQSILPKKWYKLIDAPFKISDQCCNALKKSGFKAAEKLGLAGISGSMTEESMQRLESWVQTGCNNYGSRPLSNPMAFWTEQDVLRYLKETGIPYSHIYGDIVETDAGFQTTGERRTGCMFCMFGVQREKGINRFQRMKTTHPQYWDYCINKLGLKQVLEYIGVPYE